MIKKDDHFQSSWTHSIHPWFFSLAAAFFLFTGIDWGLPSRERISAVLLDSHDTLQEILPELLDTHARQIEWNAFFRNTGKPIVQPNDPESRPYYMALLRHYIGRSEVPDEAHVYAQIARMNPRRLNFNPADHKYGGLFYYTIAGGLALDHLIGWWKIPLMNEAGYQNPELLGNLHRVGRWVCAWAGLCGAVIFFVFLQRHYGLWAAWTGGLLLVLSPTVETYTHLTKPHIFGMSISIALLWLSRYILYHENPHPIRLYGLAGFLAGAAGATAMPAAAAVLFLVVAHLLRPTISLKKSLQSAATIGVGLLLGYLAFTPYLFVSLHEFADNWRMHSTSGYQYTLWSPYKCFLFLKQLCGCAAGWPAMVLLLPFVGIIFRRDSPDNKNIRSDIPFLGFCVVSTGVLLGGLFGQLRFGLCAIPPFLACCGLGAQRLSKRGWGKILILLILGLNLNTTLAHLSHYRQNDVRLRTIAAWIKDNINPPGPIAFDAPIVPFPIMQYALADISFVFDQSPLPDSPPKTILWTGSMAPVPQQIPAAYHEIKRFPRRETFLGGWFPRAYAYSNPEEWYPSRLVVIYQLQ